MREALVKLEHALDFSDMRVSQGNVEGFEIGFEMFNFATAYKDLELR